MTEPDRRRLIVFDVDGVIVRGFWLSQILARLGIAKLFAFGILGILYEARLIEVASFMRFSFRLLKGAPRDWLIRMTNRSRLVRGVRGTFSILRRQGHILVLTSSGIPDFAVRRLAENTGAHFGLGIRVEVSRGYLTGHIVAMDCYGHSKVDAVRRLIASHNLHGLEIVAVANDRNNVSLLSFAHLPIGFRPDRVARRYVRAVISMPDLRALLPIASKPPVRVRVPRRLGQELIRQILHGSAVLIPLLWLNGYSWHLPILTIIAILCVTFGISEVLRSQGISIPLITNLVRAAGREEEIGGYAISPLLFAAGVSLPLLFSTILGIPVIGAASVCAFLVGDSLSTIGGLLYGRHHYPFNRRKTLEGTLTGFLPAFLVLLLIVSPLSAFLCAIIAGTIELLPVRIDDNLAVPVFTTTLLTILQFVGLYHFL
jgi:phosphoserine phosphatase/dolichol kinase